MQVCPDKKMLNLKFPPYCSMSRYLNGVPELNSPNHRFGLRFEVSISFKKIYPGGQFVVVISNDK